MVKRLVFSPLLCHAYVLFNRVNWLKLASQRPWLKWLMLILF